MALLTLFVFVVGCLFGSFLCLLVDRLPRGEQIMSGRSKCEHCKHVLGVFDLIPVFSYVASGGKCRYCHKKLPIHLLLIETFVGLMFVFLFLYFAFQSFSLFVAIPLFVVFFCFAGIFFTDWISGIIPDEFISIGVVATLVLLYVSNPGLMVYNLISGLGAMVFFLALFIVTRGRGMGFGDVKLAFLLGLFLGFPRIVIGLYASFLTAAVVSLILILLKKKKLRGDTIAFGPFLILGTVFAFFFATQIINHFFQ